MKVIAIINSMPGPMGDYGLVEDYGYPNIEEYGMDLGQRDNDLFVPYGGTGGTIINEEIPNIKKILLDLRNIKIDEELQKEIDNLKLYFDVEVANSDEEFNSKYNNSFDVVITNV